MSGMATTLWDDVIVGAGSAGSVLAGRLSEQADRRVLLMEAGPDFGLPDQLPEPLADARSPLMSGYHWDYSAALLAGSHSLGKGSHPAAQQAFPYRLGKVVGGSSAVNGALALRGLREDFDQWASLGNADWGWEQVLPCYKKLETDREFAGEAHGAEGPVPITRASLREWDPLQSAFYQACRGEGLADLPDLNASSEPGVGPIPSNRVDRRRVSSACAYLAPARARKNLSILGECTVHRVLFDARRAVGVECTVHGERRTVFGKRITLCAGAIGSPAILLRSGVGAGQQCVSLGVDLVADLQGVGENLADHPAVILWMAPRQGACRPGLASHQVMARAASREGSLPDLNLFMLSNVVTADVLPGLGRLMQTPLAAGISVLLTRPVSRGRLFMNSAAPGAKPVIELGLLSDPQDMERLMHGMRLAWKIARSSTLMRQVESVFMWNDNIIASDDFLRSAIRRMVSATWHVSGTTRMGAASDPMAVVDQRCRVHGLNGLRVVDAGAMPQIPSAATNLSCIMLAERIAQWMMLEEWS